MHQIEQAVFTSAETDRSAGYQIVARSNGVCEEDARELSVWGPSHDSLLELGPDALSYNFHRLPSGAFCVSRTTPAGWEYSGRGGHRVYTQCLLVPEDVLARFANNPFSLIRAVQAGGAFEVYDQVPSRLDPLQLSGGATPVDQGLLARLAGNPGPAQMARLVQAAFDSSCLAVAGTPVETLIAGLFNCLPPECRTEFSFSTGLKFSSRRPFRIVALPEERSQRSWISHRASVTMADLADEKSPTSPIDGWARFIQRVLTTGRTSFLTTQLSKRRFNLDLADLPALGLQLLEDLDASSLKTDYRAEPTPATERPRSDSTDPFVDPHHLTGSVGDPDDSRRADAAHRQFEQTLGATALDEYKASAPSKTLEAPSPAALEKLEMLDDVVYEAISGQATALHRLETLLPEVLAELGDDLFAESREQYLRYALTIWEGCVDHTGVRQSTRAVQALDVLCMLFGDA